MFTCAVIELVYVVIVNVYCRGEVALPTRRTGLTDEVTSSDEESTSSGSHHDRSSDNIVYRHTHVPVCIFQIYMSPIQVEFAFRNHVVTQQSIFTDTYLSHYSDVQF